MNDIVKNMSQERDHELVEETASTTYNNSYTNNASCVYISKSKIDTLYILSTIFEGIREIKCVHANGILKVMAKRSK